MNLNVCQRVCKPERKCEYKHKYGYEFVSRSKSLIVNINESVRLIESFSLKNNLINF